MITIKNVFIIVAITFCIPIYADTSATDAELMLNRLLHIDSNKYTVKNKDGQSFYDSLMEYKDWEKIYIKYSKYDQKEQQLTVIEMKNLLFIGFIAKTNQDAAISQSFSSDLLPIFNKNKDLMLNVLSDLKFLVPSTCYYLNNYFGFEGKNIEHKQPFIKNNTAIIKKSLGSTEGQRCLEFFTPN